MMNWLLSKLGAIVAAIVRAIIGTVAKEYRDNKVVKQTGADDETIKQVDEDIWKKANEHQPRRK